LYGDSFKATASLSSTCMTPGAAHAAFSASRRSAHERTLPFRTTVPSFDSTVILLESTSALRLKASLIFFDTSTGDTRTGFTLIRFDTVFTP
jgi:hypothetical protein